MSINKITEITIIIINNKVRKYKGGSPMEIMGVMPINKSFLTVAEAASVLGYSSCTVYKLIDSGIIEATKIGKSWKIPVESIAALMRPK